MTTEREGVGKAGKGSPSTITTAISFLAHFLLLAPVIYILVLAAGKYSAFAWHPICATIGIGLIMLEAVFCISGEAYVSSKLSRKNRVILHWVLQTLGFGFLLASVIVIIILKGSKPHFHSNHGKLGLAATILCALMLLNGICTDNNKWFYPRIKPVTLKIIHAIGGIIVTIILLASVINGTYTRWWPGTEVGRDLMFASFVIGTTLIMIKPVLGAVSRSRVVCCKPPSNR
ncbi:hypothetical protein KPH14_012433 [Odynerus spinipes]|uniref:ascorbate ferrireductase (transmembrane) n=1 Tax=Odynerus spinipes TaxID=1348599 RepID=A0AAD9RI47_9HYME|nr:hypothetical protein KPH14_012433 [Odynerus spinipes]